MFCLLVEVAWFYLFSYSLPHKARMLASDEKLISCEDITFSQSAKDQFLYSLAQTSLFLFIFLVGSCFVRGLEATLPAFMRCLLVKVLVK